MNQLEYNKSVVIRFNKEFIEGGDLDTLNEIVDASFVNHTAPAGMANDRDAVSYYITEILRKAIPDIRVHILQQVAEGDLVTTRKMFTGTHTGPFLHIPASGKQVTLHIWDTIRLRDGKYVEHWSIRDMSELTNPKP